MLPPGLDLATTGDSAVLLALLYIARSQRQNTKRLSRLESALLEQWAAEAGLLSESEAIDGDSTDSKKS